MWCFKFHLRPLGIGILLSCLTACGPSPDGTATAHNDRATSPRSRMPADPGLKSLYIQSCYSCHSSGVASAPRSGNTEDWAPRINKGMDVLLRNTLNGIGSMPPKGMCHGCSDNDLARLILFLAGESE